jgi:hypothetical protein
MCSTEEALFRGKNSQEILYNTKRLRISRAVFRSFTGLILKNAWYKHCIVLVGLAAKDPLRCDTPCGYASLINLSRFCM